MFLLLLIVIICFVFIVCYYNDTSINVDITNTTCKSSLLLGRKIFFHICYKDGYKIYDIRYFWKNDHDLLKPSIIGIQLFENEFVKMCNKCQ